MERMIEQDARGPGTVYVLIDQGGLAERDCGKRKRRA